MNVPFIWVMRDMKRSWNLRLQDKPRRINIPWRWKYKRKSKKRRNIKCRRNGNWGKRKGSKEKDNGKGSRKRSCFIEGHPCLVAFVYESDNNVVSQRLVEKLQLRQAFTWIKQGSNLVQDNVWKKYYVILLPRTLVIFFCDGHGFILKRSILMNVPFIWGMRDMKWSWNLWHQNKPRRISIRWRRK